MHTYQFLNRQVLGPGKLDFFLDSASLVVGLMIFGNFYIWSTRSFWGKLIWRLKRGVKVGTQNRVKYASNQKNKGTLFAQLFHEIWWNAIIFWFCACLGFIWSDLIKAYLLTFWNIQLGRFLLLPIEKKSAKPDEMKNKNNTLIWFVSNETKTHTKWKSDCISSNFMKKLRK